MRHDPLYRCLCNIERVPEIKDFISTLAAACGADVVYCDEAALLDDLDYVERVQAVWDNYDPEGFKYHCGSLWARREQNLIVFWHRMFETYGESFQARIPVIFTYDTIGSDVFD